MPDPRSHKFVGSAPPRVAPGIGGAGRAPMLLRVTSDPANLAPVRRSCEGFALEHGLDTAGVGDVGLCVNEAMANIIRHAYSGATDRPIEVKAELLPDGNTLRFSIRDWGTGHNPATVALRPYEPETPGGLGLICMRRLMDGMTYTPQPDGMLLVLEKKLLSARQAAIRK